MTLTRDLNKFVESLKTVNASDLSDADLVPLAKAIKSVAEYLGAIDAEIQLRAIANGKLLPGVVVKDAVVHRKWHDEAVAAELAQEQFGDRAFKRALLSPAQIEKLGPEGKALVAVASYKPEAGKKVEY